MKLVSANDTIRANVCKKLINNVGRVDIERRSEISFQMYTVRNYISCGSVSHTRSFVLDPFAETRTVTEFLEQFH